MTRKITIAAAQYNLDPLESIIAYQAKITLWVADAVGQGAEILVFPEYAAMELSAIDNKGGDLEISKTAVSDFYDEITALHQGLAKKHGIAIISGSAPDVKLGRICNIAQVFGPNGAVENFTKIMPTPGEREVWDIKGGRELKVFDIGRVKFGLVICYDIEFPLLSRALAEAGAEIILAPSDTETEWGYWRVRTGAMARALENQVYTVQAPLIGAAPFCEFTNTHFGAAGIFAPSDKGFPAGGVIALGEANVPGWTVATLDLEMIKALRTSGNVQTFKHWPEQMGAVELPKARVIDLLKQA
jgi:predicted amidohydrolase